MSLRLVSAAGFFLACIALATGCGNNASPHKEPTPEQRQKTDDEMRKLQQKATKTK